MTIHRFRLLALSVLFGLTVGAGMATAGGERIAFEATLVWGTNDPLPPDCKLKPVDEEVSRKLCKLPFKWKNYYAVREQAFSVKLGDQKEVTMSEECEILVTPLKDDKVELALRGKGKMVGKVTQKLEVNRLLVTGGNAENLTSWFVVLRRVQGD
ncbi:MAG: hypothetical protein MUC91_13865 [Verrucomicrobia bacterium]|jgi:hypothetical protein|nr:hypothetical protein [Verrucomicrobiota bacterium]